MYNYQSTYPVKINMHCPYRLKLEERSDSVVECLTRDQGNAGSSLTVLCSWARHIILCLLLVQPRKNPSCWLGCKESKQTKQVSVTLIIVTTNIQIVHILWQQLWGSYIICLNLWNPCIWISVLKTECLNFILTHQIGISAVFSFL